MGFRLKSDASMELSTIVSDQKKSLILRKTSKHKIQPSRAAAGQSGEVTPGQLPGVDNPSGWLGGVKG